MNWQQGVKFEGLTHSTDSMLASMRPYNKHAMSSAHCDPSDAVCLESHMVNITLPLIVLISNFDEKLLGLESKSLDDVVPRQILRSMLRECVSVQVPVSGLYVCCKVTVLPRSGEGFNSRPWSNSVS